MKKLAFVLIVLGSGLTALGLSCWQLAVQPSLSGGEGGPSFYYTAGWPAWNQGQITIGVMLLACGLLLRRGSN